MESCQICTAVTPLHIDARTTVSSYSGRTVFELFTLINDGEIPNLIEICYNCMEQCSEYDKLITKAHEIKENFLSLINGKTEMLEEENEEENPEYIEEFIEEFVSEVKEENIEDSYYQIAIKPIKTPNIERSSVKQGRPKKSQEVKHCPDPNCDRIFFSIKTLNAHLKFHTSERNFICQQCGKAFKTKNCLNGHTKVVHSEIRAICDECGKTFCSKHALLKHFEAKHLGLKPEVCKICLKSFHSTVSLKSHILYAHTDPESKSFSCEVCCAKFYTKSKLTRHMKTHGEREYSCSVCGRMFNHKYNVTAHMKTVHGIGPQSLNSLADTIICQLCGKIFDTKKKLEAHFCR